METNLGPVTSKAGNFTNSCGLLPPALTPSSQTVVQGTGPVSITATGCPSGIIQYFGSGGVGTIAPGGTISVPTSATGVMIISALCSYSGCVSDANVATVTVKPSVDPILSPAVTNSIGTQTATVGTNFVFLIPANTFTDPKNDPIKITVSGLPTGLTASGPVILGPVLLAGTSLITVTATNSSGYTASTTFSLVVSPATVATTDPFAITAVTTVSCATLAADQRRVTFNPQYSGLTGMPVTFSVFNEYAPTTNPGPYTLNLYTDNPSISLQASQAGTPGSVSFSYNWLSACNSGTVVANTPPTVANPIPSQTATVGQPFTYVIPANTFTDAQTPASLSLSVTNLPAGLTFTAPATISGTLSTTVGSPVTVLVKATDPGNLSVSTTFTITVLPASVTTTAPFAITGVTTISCTTVTASQRMLTFNPRYSGLNGQPVTFAAVNEMIPTTAPGPYTLRLYTDNPTITLQAVQSGTPNGSSFLYNWLSACTSGTNTAPTVANAIPPQSATVGQAFSYIIPANIFTDAETPGSLSLSVTGLPTGLSFTAPATISGVPSTTVGSPFAVQVTAIDPGSLSASTIFTITVRPSSVTTTAPFAITGVTTISCTTVTASQRMVTFTPRYSGLTGQQVTFAAVNESLPTTAPGPYTLRLYTDNPVINLQATQAGTPGTANFSYRWLDACINGSGRVSAELQEKLIVQILGNPTTHETVEVDVRGAVGQSLQLQAINGQGQVLSKVVIEQAGATERATLRIGRPVGMYFIQVSTPTQKQVVKVIKQ